MAWNLGDIYDALGDALPADRPALIHGEQTIRWGELTLRSNRLARFFLSAGLRGNSKVGFYLRNSPAYMETFVACAKARLVHVNVNYRYQEDELCYIFENSDSEAVVYGSEFADRIAAVRSRLPKVKLWIQVDFGGEVVLEGSTSYQQAVTQGDSTPLGIERSGDDLILIYTGGTTGMPKGVMWQQDDLWKVIGAGASMVIKVQAPQTLEEHVHNIVNYPKQEIQLPCCPLMHGTGFFMGAAALSRGGSVVTLVEEKLDAAEVWAAVESHQVNLTTIVGDAFAKPLLKELDANPGKYDLSCLKMITSSGVMFTQEVKQGILKHCPRTVIYDSLGSSEAVGFASTLTKPGEEVKKTSKFMIGESVKVFSEDHREILPGSEEPGFLARSGPIPRGYYNDEVKTAETFPEINGVRYSIPGDWCQVEADGSITLLGRGSGCINSAGEKIYAEEVEEAIKASDVVVDAIVLGVPDEKWGQAVTAVVQLKSPVSEADIRDVVKQRLATYKAPKHVLFREDLNRAANGKADLKGNLAFAKQQLGIES